MTVRVERRFDVEAPVEDVWAFISDPGNRARAVSVVDTFETRDDTTIWHISLPIPLLRKTIAVRTKDVELDPPQFVKFQGNSRAFDVEGSHRIEATESGSSVTNVFSVSGRMPGVERFFRRNLDGELKNLERALKRHVRREGDS
ncbi:MAG: SRPBCC family protein [Halodesulfurarchaeum sp.]